MKRALLPVVVLLAIAWVSVSIIVEIEPSDRQETLATTGRNGRVLILYHPSRDAHFTDELSLAAARAFAQAGYAVDRRTMTSKTPDRPTGYRVIAVVTNTYYWTPDRPTLRYLHRAHFDSVMAIGLVGGAGSTGRAERVLDGALRRTGAQVYATRPFWVWRPNDESRTGVPNRRVAEERVDAFVKEVVRQTAAPRGP